MRTIAIECRSIEEKAWGVGRSVAKLLEELSKNPDMAQGYHFVLLFHRKIPSYPYLDSPLFTKKILCPGILQRTPFFIYYFIILPLASLWLRVDATYYPNYMLPMLHWGKSIVVLTEDVYHAIRDPEMGIVHRIGYGVFSWWASIKATIIMTVSKTSEKEVGRLFNIRSERLRANPHGVDIGQMDTIDNKRDEGLFVYVGQAFPRRHLRETMEAFDLLANSYKQLRLTAIGMDRYPQEILRNLADNINKKHGRKIIDYRPYISDHDLVDLYNEATACIYVSFDEAFGIPPVEGAAFGAVPIVADTAVTHEIFGDKALFIKNMHSKETIADAIKKIIGNEKLQFEIRENSALIRKTYVWAAHAQRFIKILKSINV